MGTGRPSEWPFLFDLAAVVEHLGEDYARAAVQECGLERCRTALNIVEKATPQAVAGLWDIRDGRLLDHE